VDIAIGVRHCVQGGRAVECFSASGGGGEKVLLGGGVVGDGGAVGAGGVGNQFEVAAAVEVGVRFCEKEFGSGDDIRMRGCSGESDVGGLMIDRGGVVLFDEIADAARAAHRTVAAMTKPARARRHTVVTVRETSRTRRGVRNMITVLRVVSRAYEICIPLHHAESQIFDVTDSKNLRFRFPPMLPLASSGTLLPAGWAASTTTQRQGTDEAGRRRQPRPDAYASTVRVAGS